MKGILIAFGATVLLSFADAGKKRLAQSYDSYLVVWVTLLFATLFAAAYFSLAKVPPSFSGEAWEVLLVCCSLAVIGEIAFIAAVSRTDFSLAYPFGAFGPIFSTLLAFLILGESLTAEALVGCFLVVVGSFVLYSPSGRLSPRHALQLVIREESPKYMLLVCAVYAMIGVLQKHGARLSAPLDFALAILVGEFIFFSLALPIRGLNPVRMLREVPLLSLGTGALWATGMTAIFVSFSYTLVAHVGAVKQLGLLFAIPIGYYFFRERQALSRFLPVLLMLGGVLFIMMDEL